MPFPVFEPGPITDIDSVKRIFERLQSFLTNFRERSNEEYVFFARDSVGGQTIPNTATRLAFDDVRIIGEAFTYSLNQVTFLIPGVYQLSFGATVENSSASDTRQSEWYAELNNLSMVPGSYLKRTHGAIVGGAEDFVSCCVAVEVSADDTLHIEGMSNHATNLVTSANGSFLFISKLPISSP